MSALLPFSTTQTPPLITLIPSMAQQNRKNIKQNFSVKIKFIAAKIVLVTSTIILSLVDPTFFAFGFVGGLIYNKKVPRLDERVNQKLDALNCLEGCFLFLFTLIFFEVIGSAYITLVGIHVGFRFANRIDRQAVKIELKS